MLIHIVTERLAPTIAFQPDTTVVLECGDWDHPISQWTLSTTELLDKGLYFP